VTVHVETAARLHFGVLDLRGGRGRWFGGIGAGAPGPTLEVSASPAATITATGPDAERAADFASKFLLANGFDGGAAITVHRALPPHAGLGSGTQLALAVARALAELRGVDTDTRALAHAVGRGRRSAIGTWTFDGGGLVVEGGKRRDGDGCGPLLARIPFPASWRCVVAIPHIGSALSGQAEASAIAQLPAPPEREVERVSHLVLLSLLPALADADLAAFGAALSELQQVTGQWWASVQGSVFAPGITQELVQRMADWGASGVGQSSWGPTVYGVVDGEAAGAALAARVRERLGESGQVYEGPFRAAGARVWRTS